MIGSALNRVRRFAHGDGWLVRREWAPPSVAAMLGVDPAVEVAAQQLAAGHGLAPPVLEFDPQARFMVMPFVEGVRLETDWLLRPARCVAVRDLLMRLRTLRQPLLPPLDLLARACELHSRLALYAPLAAQRWQSRLAECLPIAAAGPGVTGTQDDLPAHASAQAHASTQAHAYAPAQAVLVHGDLGPHNVLVRPDGSLCLLDWEYAHSGHGDEDLAGLLPELPSAAAAAAGLEEWSLEPTHLPGRLRLRRLLDGLWRELVAVGVESGWQEPADPGKLRVPH